MQRLVEIGPVVLEKDFLISSMYFRYFVIISPWKRTWLFIWTNLNHLYPRMLCATLVETAQWFWRRSFFNFVRVVLLFHHYLIHMLLSFSSGELKKNLRWVTVYYSQTIVLWNFDLIWCKLCKFDLHYEKNYGTIPTRSRGPWATSLAWEISLKQ